MNQVAKYLIIAGIFLLILGGVLLFRDRIPLIKYLGQLPGDIRVEREGFGLYLPITTSILISVLVSVFVFFSTFRMGKKAGAEKIVESPKEAKLLYQAKEKSISDIKLPEVEAIVEIKLKRGTPVYLGRDDLLVDWSLFVPSSGGLDIDKGDLQQGSLTLRDGTALDLYMSSMDTLFLVPKGADPKTEGQLFIRSK